MKLHSKIIFTVVLIFACLFFGSYCLLKYVIFSPTALFENRVNSPAGDLDAVYIQYSTGAMTSMIHKVYIVPTGKAVSKADKEIFDCSRPEDFEISWDGNRKLIIKYSQANIYHFKNFAFPFPDDYERKVTIEEIKVMAN